MPKEIELSARENFEDLRQWGLHVVPARPESKKPIVKWKNYQEQPPTDRKVKKWAEEHPDCNFIVITGKGSGVVVLDIDSKKGEEFVSEKGVPQTPVSKTKKGHHIWFKHPGKEVRNFARRIPGVDFRGDGGYVIAPYSDHPDGGQYEWVKRPDEVPFADIPHWLLKLFKQEESTVSPSEAVSDNIKDEYKEYFEKAFRDELGKVASATEGRRNNTLNQSAFNLYQIVHAGGLDESIVTRRLASTAKGTGLPESEIKATLQSAKQSAARQPRDLTDLTPKSSYSGGKGKADLLLPGKKGDKAGNKKVEKHNFRSPSQVRDRAKHLNLGEKLLTGIEPFDNKFYRDCGNRKGQTEVIEAITGHGKSTFLAYKTALFIKQGYKGAWFQTEDQELNTLKLVEAAMGPDKDKLEGRFWVSDEYRYLRSLMNGLKTLNETVDLDFIAVDYLQGIYVKGADIGQDRERIKIASRHLTNFAAEQNVFLMKAAQPSKDPGRHKWNAEPKIRDLHGSSQIEKDAFTITTVFRPSERDDLYDKQKDRVEWWDGSYRPPNCVQMRQLKNRYQPRVRDTLTFQHRNGRFELYSGSNVPAEQDKFHKNGNEPFNL